MKTVCILGLGYIGLPTSVLLANSGFRVFGVDIKKEIVKKINEGQSHFSEPGLDTFLQKAIKSRSLSAHLKPLSADVYIIAVPTPFENEIQVNKIPNPNLDYVMNAAKSIKNVIKPGSLVILESTSPVGTTQKISDIITSGKNSRKEEFYFAYSPERVLPGKILEELENLDRVVGTNDNKSRKKAFEFYKSFCKGKIHSTETKIAELSKLTENAYRDVNIAFANEISLICSKIKINPYELISLANYHPRVNILQPGCGVGGHCIAVDPWFIASQYPENTKLIQAARLVNNLKPKKIVEQILLYEKTFIKNNNLKPILGIMGLTFKADVDDMRESPALKIALELISLKKDVLCCEPNIKSLSEIKLYSLDDILNQANIIIFLVPHKQFKKIELINYNFIDFCGIQPKKENP